MSRKDQRQRGKKAEGTTSNVQPNLLKTPLLTDVGKAVADDFASTHAITGTSNSGSLSSEITRFGGETSTSPVARSGTIETHLAEDTEEEPTTSSLQSEPVESKPEKYVDTGWAFADKYFGWLLSGCELFLPLVAWIAIVASMVVIDNYYQLLGSANGRFAFLVKSMLPLTFCLFLYLPIVWLKKDWGWIRKGLCLAVVICAVVGSCFFSLYPWGEKVPGTVSDPPLHNGS